MIQFSIEIIFVLLLSSYGLMASARLFARKVDIKIDQARVPRKLDSSGAPDVFVSVYVMLPGDEQTYLGRTTAVSSRRPEWDETFRGNEYSILQRIPMDSKIYFKLYDQDSYDRAEFIGRADTGSRLATVTPDMIGTSRKFYRTLRYESRGLRYFFKIELSMYGIYSDDSALTTTPAPVHKEHEIKVRLENHEDYHLVRPGPVMCYPIEGSKDLLICKKSSKRKQA